MNWWWVGVICLVGCTRPVGLDRVAHTDSTGGVRIRPTMREQADTLHPSERLFWEVARSMGSSHNRELEADWWDGQEGMVAARAIKDSARILMAQAMRLSRQSDSAVGRVVSKVIFGGVQLMGGKGWELGVQRSSNLWDIIGWGAVDQVVPRAIQVMAGDLAMNLAGKVDMERWLEARSPLNLEQALVRLPPGERVSTLGQMASVRLAQGNWGDATRYLEQGLFYARAAQIVSGDLYLMLGSALALDRQVAKARPYVDSAISIGKQSSRWQLVSDGYRQLHRLNRSAGIGAVDHLLDSAIVYHEKQDQLMLDQRVAQVGAQYVLREKNQRIAMLAAMAAANQQISDQRQLIIVALSAGALLLLLSSWLLYRRYRLRLQIREQELLQQLLRSQMEGHFMYNSLANVQGLVRERNHEGAMSYLGKFARLLQLNQFNSRSAYVSLMAELQALDAYLALQQVHHDNSFNYEIITALGSDQDRLLIPPMLLQPFVENAVVHGMGGLPYPGFIRVVVEKNKAVISCRIEDNGQGHRPLPALAGKPSLSMQITRERLHILGRRTGVRCRLEIRPRFDQNPAGTVVEVDMPYRSGRG